MTVALDVVQVYYIPRLPFYANATVPTIFGAWRLLRCILIRERIQLVRPVPRCLCNSPPVQIPAALWWPSTRASTPHTLSHDKRCKLIRYGHAMISGTLT